MISVAPAIAPQDRPGLSVVVPAFNESHRLPRTLAEIRPYLEAAFPDHEVLVVDDGSSDETPAIVTEAARAWPKLRLERLERNTGKGAAVKRGMLAATKPLVLFMDADHATPIVEMERFLPVLIANPDSGVVGVRTYQSDGSKWRRIVGLGLQMLTHLIVYDYVVVDSQCGFKAFGREAGRRIFERCTIRGGMFDVELFAIAHRLGVPLWYEPVRWFNKEGSRIDILRCFVFDPFDMIKIRLNDLRGRYGREDGPPALPSSADARA